jgi:phosphate-selective porin OprO/OprP
MKWFGWFFIGGCICVGQVHGKDAFQSDDFERSQFEWDNVEWKAQVLIDQDYMGAAYQKGTSDSQTHTELRSAKLSVKWRPFSQWQGRVQLEASEQEKRDDGFEIGDAWFRWKSPSKNWQAWFGQFKEPMGHERLMGSGSSPTIERSMATTAFAPGRSVGVMVGYRQKQFTLSSGVFQAEPEEQEIFDKHVDSWTTRATYTGKWQNEVRWHVGSALSLRQLNDSLFQIEERAEVNSADNVIFSGRYYGDQQITSQVEAGASWLQSWWMAEYFQSTVDASDGDSWQYHGFYLQWVYGGHHRYKHGQFKSPKTKGGQWQLVMRYSGLDLRDNGLGTEAGSLMLGGNYRFSRYGRIMVSYLQPTLSGNVVNTDLTGAATSARLQFEF